MMIGDQTQFCPCVHLQYAECPEHYENVTTDWPCGCVDIISTSYIKFLKAYRKRYRKDQEKVPSSNHAQDFAKHLGFYSKYQQTYRYVTNALHPPLNKKSIIGFKDSHGYWQFYPVPSRTYRPMATQDSQPAAPTKKRRKRLFSHKKKTK